MQAPADAQAAFTASVTALKEAAAAAKAASQGAAGDGGGPPGLPPGVKVEEAYVLAAPGAKDGETKLVKEADGSVWAYGWDASKAEWEKIGEVVAAPEAGRTGGGDVRMLRRGISPLINIC